MTAPARSEPTAPISVVILTVNEEVNIADCLASCRWCDDVHVLDSGSTDKTAEIAESCGARVHVHPFESFGDQRNWAIDHIPTRHDWIFHLDADERFTPQLVEAMRDLLAGDAPQSGFHVPHKLMFMGRWLKRSGAYPTYQMRLFHKGRMRFCDYGHGQRELTNGQIGVLDEPYLHYVFSKGLDEWLDKHNRYSSLEAWQLLDGRRDAWSIPTLFSGHRVTRRRAWKEFSYRLPCRAALRWFVTLFVLGGVFEGRPAWAYARLVSMYEHMISLKLRQLRWRRRTGQPVVGHERVLSIVDGAVDPTLDTSAEGFLNGRLGRMVKPGTRVLLTGGSGFIGTNLVQLYHACGAEVINIDKNPPRNPAHRDLWREIDIRDADRLLRCVRDFEPELFFHLAARTDLDKKATTADYDENIGGVANVLRSVEGLSSLRRIIITSTQLVCRPGYRPKGDDDYKPNTEYGRSKIETERATRSWKNAPCPWTLVRPTSIWGPWFDVPYRDFFITIARRQYRHPRGTNPLRSFGFVGNIMFEYVALTDAPQEKVHGRTFYMSDLQAVHVRDWASAIQAEMGLAPLREVPVWTLAAVAKLGDLTQRAGLTWPPITTFRLKNLLADNYCDMEPVGEVIGSMPYTLPEGVRITVRWMRETGLI